jgi:hypothetical protein
MLNSGFRKNACAYFARLRLILLEYVIFVAIAMVSVIARWHYSASVWEFYKPPTPLLLIVLGSGYWVIGKIDPLLLTNAAEFAIAIILRILPRIGKMANSLQPGSELSECLHLRF